MVTTTLTLWVLYLGCHAVLLSVHQVDGIIFENANSELGLGILQETADLLVFQVYFAEFLNIQIRGWTRLCNELGEVV